MNRRTPDLVLIVALVLLVGFGLTMVYSASSYADVATTSIWRTYIAKQVVAVLLGVVALGLAMVADLQTLKKYHLFSLGACLFLLILVPVIGDGAKGAERWIGAGPVKFQPSELTKIAVIVSLATWFEQNRTRINDLKQTLLPAGVVLAAIAGLLMAQPDFGTTMVIAGTAGVMAYFAGLNRQNTVGLLGIGAVLGTIAVLAKGYRLDRVSSFRDPVAQCKDSGYQVCQSMAAYHRGGWSGLGWGDGAAKLHYLPEPHNDFIAAVVGEELGLVGFLFLLVLFAFVGARCWRVAIRTKDYWSFLVVSSFTVLTMGQAAFNLAVSLGMVPPKGLVLPFVSYGASAMLANLLGMGLVLNISSQDPDAEPEPSGAEAVPAPADTRRGEAQVSVPTRA